MRHAAGASKKADTRALPAEAVGRAPASLPGAELALVVALVQVLAVPARLRRRRG